MPRTKKQNRLTSPELLEQVLPQNKRLVSDFLKYLRSIKRSEQTIRGYENDLQIWMVWNLLNNNNKRFVDLKKRDVVAMQSWLIEQNQNSPARVRRIKSAMSSLSNYIADVLDDEYEGYMPIIRKVSSPDLSPVYDKTILTDNDVEKVLSTLVAQKQFQRACAFALAIASGARLAELTRFKTEFFRDENIIFGSLYKTPPIKTKGRSGGKYISKYVLVNLIKPYLEMWLKEREQRGIDCEYLFVVYDHNEEKYVQISRSAMVGWARSISQILGQQFYWHATRHYWTSYLLRSGIPEDVVSDLSGWSSVDMVATYDDRDKDETFAKYFRDGRIVTHKQKTLADI